jgi:hypothetical protein
MEVEVHAFLTPTVNGVEIISSPAVALLPEKFPSASSRTYFQNLKGFKSIE